AWRLDGFGSEPILLSRDDGGPDPAGFERLPWLFVEPEVPLLRCVRVRGAALGSAGGAADDVGSDEERCDPPGRTSGRGPREAGVGFKKKMSSPQKPRR